MASSTLPIPKHMQRRAAGSHNVPGAQAMRGLSQESFLKAALEAGVSWDGAFAVVDMMHYAAAAAQLPVARSGQSAFSWVPLVAVAASAQNMAASDAAHRLPGRPRGGHRAGACIRRMNDERLGLFKFSR